MEKKIPKGQQNEIIEIGICVLDSSTYERVVNDSIIVKPFSEVSQFCTDLTTLTQPEVNQGISLKDACEILQTQYFSKERSWASYGAYDKKQFERECQKKGVGYPFSNDRSSFFHARHKINLVLLRSTGIQDLSSKSTAQDKSCTPPLDRNTRFIK